METQRQQSGRSLALAAILVLGLSLSNIAPAGAQGRRESVGGVTNFGRVTDLYFRGGKVTPEGVQNLFDMGVRTIVDLAGKGGDEETTCKRLGIRFFSFPMNGSETPEDAKVEQILSIVQNAKEPVYVHCSAGKHRAGTICALYRTRVQGWSPDEAWAEQQSYGFGSADGHPELFAYVYGKGGDAIATNGTNSGGDRNVLTRTDSGDRESERDTDVAKSSKAKKAKKPDAAGDENSDGRAHKSKKHDSEKDKKHDDDKDKKHDKDDDDDH